MLLFKHKRLVSISALFIILIHYSEKYANSQFYDENFKYEQIEATNDLNVQSSNQISETLAKVKI